MNTKLLAIVFLVFVGVFAQVANAMSFQEASSRLGSAKAEGLVGERGDGYLGVVRDTSEARDIVRLINQARRQEYQRIAGQEEIDISKVEALAGQRAVERTQSGHYIFYNGEWVAKP